MGPVRRATIERVAAIDAPDVALVALAYRLADMLDDPETATASAAKEYRVTITQLAAQDAKTPTVYDLDDSDD
tara:strand:+ start:119 stop:337 length:219 start_codon:yes stop_codon:yes gene_type:complete